GRDPRLRSAGRPHVPRPRRRGGAEAVTMSTPQTLDPRCFESLGDLLGDALLTFKSEVALIAVDRQKETKRWSYLDARREPARVVALLEQHRIGADDRVAIL